MTRPPIAVRDVYHLAVIATLVIVGALPSERLRDQIARRLGGLAYVTSRTKRRRAEANVELTLGERVDRRRIVRSSLDEFWREMLCWTSPLPRAEPRITGLQHLHEALALGNGAILWESNGFGRRAASKQVLQSIGLSVHQVHGRDSVGGFLVPAGSDTWVREKLVKPFFDRRENRWANELVYLPATESLAFTRHLRGILEWNALLCVAADGGDGRRRIPLVFLGRMTPFATGMVSLSLLTGAPLLPLLCSPDDDGFPHLTIGSPIRVDPAGGREAIHDGHQAFATLLDAQIRREPGRYRNWHVLEAWSADERAATP